MLILKFLISLPVLCSYKISNIESCMVIDFEIFEMFAMYSEN
jgi:hypothetical protein